MCGLAGIIRKNSKVTFPKAALEDLIYVTQLRGVHSAGMIYSYIEKDYVKKTEQHMIGHTKEAGLPWSWVKNDQTVAAQQRRLDNKVMAFHCRWATKGQVTKENAHPFKENNILLMHNGTLRNDYQLNQKYFQVDSHAVTYYLAQPGNTPQSFVKKVEGAYALVWMDYNDGSLNFLRNDDRTLFFAENEDFVVWASEAAFLTFINDRHALHLSHPEAFPSFVHRKFDVINGGFVDTEMEKPEVKKLPSMSYGGWYGREDDFDDLYNQVPSNKIVPINDRRSSKTAFDPKDVPEYALATPDAYLKYFEKLIALGNYPYHQIAAGYVTKNSQLPSTTIRGYSAWDFITNNQEAFSLTYDVEFSPESHVAVSIQGCRVLKIDGDFVLTECQFPIQWKELANFKSISLWVSRAEYAKAKRNDLLIKGEVAEIDHIAGTLVLRGGVIMPCFDPCVEGSVTEQEALNELNDAVQNAKAGIQ